MRERRWLLLAVYGILLTHAVTAALKASRQKFKIATTSTSTTTQEIPVEDNEESENLETTTVSAESNATTGRTLTGIPQIDYIWDPNLPRELNGYNLSEYPFYNSIPEDIDFKCDGLHDGFYASVPHKCQVYHHCLYGTRYDFLCANFTAFDQRTFICHFVSEVDCANSKKFWHRNDALYKAATTTTTSTSTTTTTTTTAAPATVAAGRPSVASRDRDSLPRRRRPFRRRPAYDYYDEEYYDDEYGRPRGYDRRDDYEYEDRKYRRDRDRDFRDRERDFRDRDATTRTRDTPERDRESMLRDRFPSRSNRRDPLSRPRDPLEEEPRPRSRPQDPPATRTRDAEEPEFEERRTDPRSRDTDDRRYMDKRFKDEYEDKETPTSVVSPINQESLVKPAAPSTSVYSRPRAPPKIRRPVPISEQDRFAYKATAAQPITSDEPRRRPADMAEEDEYYEDELEDVRPRRPMRRRPMFRDRDREFYEVRDRPFRPRYRDEEDDIRPRKQPDRSRDRYYERDRDRSIERGRDRSLDRSKDRTQDRPPLEQDRGRSQDMDRPDRLYGPRPTDRDRKEGSRSRSSSRSKDLFDEPPRKQNGYERTTEKSTTTSSTTNSATTTCTPESPLPSKEQEIKELTVDREDGSSNSDKPNRQSQGRLSNNEDDVVAEKHVPISQADYQDKSQQDKRAKSQQQQTTYLDEYSSEYYDETEDTPAPPPRPTVRIVKRPFLPSRGGNPNPRGLSPVGTKAANALRRDENRSTERNSPREDSRGYYAHAEQREPVEEAIREQKEKQDDARQLYDAYKVIQSDLQQKQRPEDYESSVPRTPSRGSNDRNRQEESQKPLEEVQLPSRGQANERQSETVDTLERSPPVHQWTAEDGVGEKETSYENSSMGSQNRGKVRGPPAEQTNYYGSTYKNEEVSQEQSTSPNSLRAKQRINEVTHRLQDIPESEYDVTLNDALTPTLNQESNLPSGFVLPFQRAISRDAVLQPSENTYKISRPSQQQQQKPFVPSPQILPATNERSRSTMYFRTPEAVQVSNSQYRSQRVPWQDYAGY